jgi:hypothetical protein
MVCFSRRFSVAEEHHNISFDTRQQSNIASMNRCLKGITLSKLTTSEEEVEGYAFLTEHIAVLESP